MPTWLDAALAYIPQWLAFQRELLEQPGVSLAIAHNGRVVLESAFGVANQATGEAMTPRHRFRVASHSKTFTTVGILKLVEAGRLRLDDKAGHYVPGLHASVADVSIRELLSNNAGLVRDGRDGGQFNDRRPYLDRDELIADLAVPQPLPAGETMKYSNHGFALAGLIIAAVVKEPYLSWIGREVVAAAGLKETEPDITVGTNTPFASGHTLRVPLGRRLVVPGDNPARAMASAAGYVATTADLARFYSTLVPTAPSSVISAHSRRTDKNYVRFVR